MTGLAEEYKHLVGATHSDDADFHSVVKLVQQGYKMKISDWSKVLWICLLQQKI